MRRNFLFVILVIVISFATAPYFGAWYDKFSPQEGSAFWGLDKNSAVAFAGFPFAYTFLVPLVLGIFGSGNKNKWIAVLLIPSALLWIVADVSHIYLPIILGVIGFILAKLINLIVSKIKKPKQGMTQVGR